MDGGGRSALGAGRRHGRRRGERAGWGASFGPINKA